MNNIKEILKSLRIRKEVNFDSERDEYYFIGYESQLLNIETKLENSNLVKNVYREFFTNGFGRIVFKINC